MMPLPTTANASPRLLGWLVGAALLLGLMIPFGLWQRQQTLELRAQANIVADRQVDSLQSHLSRALSPTYAVAALLRQGNGQLPQFEELALAFLDTTPGLGALQLAPGGVVRHIVPLESNEAALGHNLLSDSDRNAEARLAIVTRQLTLAGPFDLKQGGVAMVGRLPVYLPHVNATSDDSFWGFVNVLIRLPAFLQATKFDQLTQEGYAHALWRVHPDTGAQHLIAGSADAMTSDAQTRAFAVPNGEWRLSLRPHGGWVSWPQAALGLLLVAGLATAAGMATCRVVSKRRQLLAHLEQSLADETLARQRFYDFSASSADWLWESDAEHRFTYFSDNFEAVYGRPAHDVLGRTRLALLNENGPNEPAAVNAHIGQLMRHEAFRDFEYGLPDENGKVRWIEVSGLPVFDPDGHFAGYRGTGRIVTERKRLMNALAESQQRTRRMIDSIQDPYACTDMSGRLIEWNGAFRQLLGYSDDDLGRLSHRDITPSRWHEMEDALVHEQLLTKGHTAPYEKAYIRKDGSTVDVELALFLLRDPQGQPEAIWAVSRDITERKQVDSAKNRFLSNMSHEMRTPLNAMLGYARILENTPLNLSQRNHLQKMRGASEHLLNLVNDVLDYAKLEAGELTLTPEAYTWKGLLGQVKTLLQTTAKTGGVELVVHPVPPVLDEVWWGDAQRIRQVLINLVGNAIKFTPKGLVSVHLAPATDAPHTVVITVQDSGIGIAADVLPQLLRQFTQADDASTRAYQGAGLGLAIVKELLHAMGGQLHIDSVLGVGTKVSVRLPLVLAKHNAQPAVAGDGGDDDLRGVGVLVVDDADVNRQLVTSLLSARGAVVHEAENGQAALTWLLAHPRGAQVVLMDVSMPVMDGLTATRLIRAMDGLQKLPIVAMTSGGKDENRQDAAEAGMSDYLVKPINPEALMRTVAHWARRV